MLPRIVTVLVAFAVILLGLEFGQLVEALLIDRPDEKYTGAAVNCTRLFLNSQPFSDGVKINGLDESIGPLSGDHGELLTIRAVYYEPRPVGTKADLQNDLYTAKYSNFHERDLYIIKNILRANAVRLAPWSSKQDHSRFFKACKKYGLFVVPTFDLGFFFGWEAKAQSFSVRQQEVWEGVQEFMKNAVLDSGGDEDIILMWSMNYGLNLNETTEFGPLSGDLPLMAREEYFELVKTVRLAQWFQECGQKGDRCKNNRFKRPLALPLKLGSKLRQDNIGWYLGFSESRWGVWPPDQHFLGLDPQSFDQLRPQGAFDAWIAEALPPSTGQAQDQLMGDVMWFNATMAESHNSFVWHDVWTQNSKNLDGDPIAGCNPDVGCTYPTRKLVVVQYGFAAQDGYGPETDFRLDSGLQQKLLSKVWDVVQSKDTCTSAGAIVDEWVDDWDRTELVGCKGSAYQHPLTGPCDEVRPGWVVRYEWFGLNGQYTFLWLHCLDPRYSRDHPAHLGNCPSDDPSAHNSCAFRFDNSTSQGAEQALWDKIPSGYCVSIREPGWLLAINAALLIFGLLLEVVFCFGCRWCRKEKAPLHVRRALPSFVATNGMAAPLTNNSRGSSYQANLAEQAERGGDVEITGRPMRRDSSEAGLSASASTASSSIPRYAAVVEARVTLRIPEWLSTSLVYPEGFAEIPIILKAAAVRDGKVFFSNDLLRVHAEAHVRTQCNKLTRQLEAEVLAVQEISGWRCGPKDCSDQAMINLHARVMEGYVAWLDYQRDLPNKDEQVKAMLGDESNPRPSWMLYAEAALLRAMESLAEHTLHAPELMAFLYHQVRWASPMDRTDGVLPEDSLFSIDYDALHAGLEAMRKNMNSFTGGLNFDDLNDYGEARLPGAADPNDMWKTYRESSSWRVFFDLLDNFYPVLTVKLWVFFFAWYAHLGFSSPYVDFFDPINKRSDSLQVMALSDACILILMELALLWHGFGQRRLWWPRGRRGSKLRQSHGRWARRHVASLAVGMVSLVAMCLPFAGVGQHLCSLTPEEDLEDPEVCKDPKAIRASLVYFAVRMIAFVLLTRRHGIPFVQGTPEARKKKGAADEYSSPTDSYGTEGSNSSDRTMIQEDGPRVVGRKRGKHVPLLVWTGVLLLCFFFETYFVAPLVSGFSFRGFCGDACGSRLYAWSIHLPLVGYIHPFPSECIACLGTILAIYTLVLMTAFLDMHFIFYLIIGVGGYAMGEERGLRNVLSSALRHLDLDASTIGREASLADHDGLSDGRAMERVFGSGWRLVWSCTVESLYDDCLISDGIANRMVAAARTIRWRDREAAEMQFAGPSQRFQRIRFRATALRGGGNSWAQAGPTSCVSALEVKHGPCSTPELYTVPKSSSRIVQVCTAEEHADLLKVLDDRLITTAEIKELGVGKGWQLLTQQGPAEKQTENGGATPSRPSLFGRPKAKPRPSVAEDLSTLRELTNFPVDLIFTVPSEYKEVVIEFKRPRRIYAISFWTTADDRQFDPIRWEVDGSPDGTSWQRLQSQLVDFDTPSARKCLVSNYFNTEPWRCPKVTGPTSFDLRSVPGPVSERLCFFASSLRAIMKESSKPECRVRPGRDTLLDCHLGAIPSLTQIVPVYSEQVILSEEFLRSSDGRSTNLGFLISQAEEEWNIFASKQGMSPLQLFSAYTNGDINLWLRRADYDQDEQRRKELEELLLEVRLWASNRSQTVARTMAGAIQYHKALEILPCVSSAESPAKALEGLVQLIVAHQTYGNKKFDDSVDRDVRTLILKYSHYPVLLVCDYDASVARSSFKEAVTRFLAKEHRYTSAIRYASVLLRFNENYSSTDSEENILKVAEVLPRCYSLVLGEKEPKPPFARTQGKAANQLGALRFAPGHYLQMMDANMGATFGEACKVPFVLRRFQPAGWDRKTVRARIIGFREHIFTGAHGAVGGAMADAEWTFGTVCQRFLAGLGARMHYGHPDFFDSFWASNRGSVSKASAVMNLSEDIFAGFNVRMRGEKSKHVDCLEWEKGREVSFNKASQFFTKVASGNVGVMRSRDLKVITENLNIADSFSFYFASVGFYLYNMLTDLSMTLYVIIFILLTLASRTLNDVGKLDSLLAAEWVVSFGTLAMFPRLMELTLEYGVMEGVTRFLPSVPGSMVMFTFLNKSIASAVSSSMRTGHASYIATGRPTANNHYSWRECYFLYRETHYYPAVRIFMLYAVYRLLADGFSVAALPMMVLLATATVWIVGPMLFCPQPTIRSLRDDLSEFWYFCIGGSTALDRAQKSIKNVNLEAKLSADASDARANLYDVWLSDKLKHKRAPIWARIVEMGAGMFLLMIMMLVVYGSMVDQMRTVFFLFSVNYYLLALWRYMNRPTIIMMLSFMFWLAAIPSVLASDMVSGQFGTLLVAFILTFQALHVLEKILLLIAWAILRPDPDVSTMPETTDAELKLKEQAAQRIEKYDAVVEYLYLSFMSYQRHLYVAGILLVANLISQLFVVVLETLGGLHSWYLLNGNLKGGFCRTRRQEYKPKGSDFEPMGERYLQLSKGCSSFGASERSPHLRNRAGNTDHVELQSQSRP